MADQQQLESDMARFFDFSDTVMPDAAQSTATPSPLNEHSIFGTCPLHPNEICFCLETSGELLPEAGFEINPTELDPTVRVPKFSRPQNKCNYCQSLKLDCFFSYEEQKSCSSCTALFRPCIFSEEPSRGCVMNTLHTVTEDQVIDKGSQTGIITLKSFNYAAATGRDDSRIPSRKTGIRFSRSNIKLLKDWMHEHRDHPYPTEEEKEDLCSKTSLNPTQISNWLANTRRRAKQTMRPASPHAPSNAIDIRPNKQGLTHKSKEWENLNPMDRWKISPPEHEAAKVEDIAQAVATSDLGRQDCGGASREHSHRGLDSSGNSDSQSLWQTRGSSASLDTGFSALSSNSFSNNSLGSSLSHGSSRNSFGSFGRKVSKDYRRRRRTAADPSRKLADDKRLFECTFCTDKFKSKYDWARHEKSLHLSLEKWICSPIGEVVTDPATGARKCVFCDLENPDTAHLEIHKYRTCEEKGLQARTFYRKDHLRQHLRLMHSCKMIPAMEAWKSETTFVKCRCGFCGAEFTRWGDRVDHLAKHFRNRSTMKEWKGCRGLEPDVAAQVTNAMPPYLIANEQKSPMPFSATNESSMYQLVAMCGVDEGRGMDLEALIPNAPEDDASAFTKPTRSQAAAGSSGPGSIPSLTLKDTLQMHQSAPLSTSFTTALPGYPVGRPTLRANTCWEILTVKLGRFVAEQLAAQPSVLITDAMLQRQARLIVYDNDDPWNQTAADNPEWLRLFRQAHNIATEGMLLDAHVDPVEDLGMAELSFDHFFEPAGSAQMDSFAEAMSRPLDDAETADALAATTGPQFDFGDLGMASWS